MFWIYLQEGFKHITDFAAYDHMAYLLALTAGFTSKKWKELITLITAFTLGHSVTLLLAATDKILIPSSIIEFLIPITILLTALFQLTKSNKKTFNAGMAIYTATFFFGLIHGSGFSNHFKALMGKSSNITVQLLSFNLGVELGQILIVSILLFITYLITEIVKVQQTTWKAFLSILAVIISVYLIIKTWPF